MATIKSKTAFFKDKVDGFCDRLDEIKRDCKQNRIELMSTIETCENSTHKECPVRKLINENYTL